MPNKTAAVCVLALIWSCVSCGPHKLSSDEVERNRLFSELIRRTDRRVVGDDGFFERTLLSPPYPATAQWSAIALGRIGNPRALPWLYEALARESAALRAAALFAIGEIEDRETLRVQGLTRDPDAVARVRAMLDDSAATVRMRAMEALGKIGDPADAPAVSSRMLALAQDGSPDGRALLSLGITALMRLSNPGEHAVLHSLAASPDPELQWRALNALVRLRDRGACASFRRATHSRDPDVRAHAARGLGLCGSGDAALLEALVESPSQPPQVRVCAVRALGEIRNPAAVAAITRALRTVPVDGTHPEHLNFAAEAAAALGDIGSPDAVATLCELLPAGGPVRNAGVVALAKVLHAEPDRFFQATEGERPANPAAMRAWARALGQLGGTRACRELRAMLRAAVEPGATGSHALALPAVVESLAAAQDPDLPDIVTTMLRSHDGAVLRAALAVYDPTDAPKPWQSIAQSYASIAGGNDVETKAAFLDRLEPWAREPEVAALLERALRDPSRNARIAAARLLRLAGRSGVPDDPGPAESTLTDISYDLIASARKDRTVASIETERGHIEIELFREDAPVTVANFVQLARNGFYNGLTFMRVVPYFVVQGGDPRNDQEGGPGYSIRCEINMRPYERGSVGMALAGKDTGGSQFFITLAPQPHLDGGYTCFGRVIAGMDVVDRITAGDQIRQVQIIEDVTMIDYRRF